MYYVATWQETTVSEYYKDVNSYNPYSSSRLLRLHTGICKVTQKLPYCRSYRDSNKQRESFKVCPFYVFPDRLRYLSCYYSSRLTRKLEKKLLHNDQGVPFSIIIILSREARLMLLGVPLFVLLSQYVSFALRLANQITGQRTQLRLASYKYRQLVETSQLQYQTAEAAVMPTGQSSLH